MSRFSNVLLVMNACNLNKRVFDMREPMGLRRCVNGIKRLPNGRVGDDGYRVIKVEYVSTVVRDEGDRYYSRRYRVLFWLAAF